MGSTSSEQHKNLLSKIATNHGHGEDSPYFDGWKAYDNNPFHATQNPNGVIQMGLAENQLCIDLIEDWIRRNPQASICTTEGLKEFMAVANFQDYHGLPAFREAVAKFMGKVRGGVTFNPNRIVMGGGSTGANEIITFCLADPGEAFLIPSPYYPAFERDLRWRTGVQLLPVVCESSNDFKIAKASLEVAYQKAQDANINVKGLIITNPSNPLGTILDRETLQCIVSFINEKSIHLVCDEIYAATVFTEPKFISIAEIIEEDDVACFCNRDLIHIVYSLSKDLGFPGFRVGIVYSYNDEVVNCARKMSSFGLVSTQTQHLISSMLSDDEFVGRFISESANRLATRYKVVTSELAKVGIGCLKSNAGLYCWMDLKKLLKVPTLEEEMVLWRVIINDVKLNVSPGSSFRCSEPGWFRVCFANMDNETVEVALKRIQSFVGRKSREADDQVPAVKSKRFKTSLRLSFSSTRRIEEAVMSPCSMSPHSPLVSART